MTTLIAVYTSDGCVGRCDAKCYNATSAECDCVCGGANHGAGFQQAAENTRQMASDWLQRYAQEKGLESWFGEVPALAPIQLPLFTDQ
ncbi:MAG: hypothetical protein FOGNACKC_03473 [Anaerolineae bacterium]|nr:hypothetical protein [Anaerolineae bacterium]